MGIANVFKYRRVQLLLFTSAVGAEDGVHEKITRHNAKIAGLIILNTRSLGDDVVGHRGSQHHEGVPISAFRLLGSSDWPPIRRAQKTKRTYRNSFMVLASTPLHCTPRFDFLVDASELANLSGLCGWTRDSSWS